MKAQNYYVLGNALMVVSISIMSIGVYIGFFEHSSYTIPQQIVAHIGIMIGAALLKLGYVMRLAATKRINEIIIDDGAEIIEPDMNTFVRVEEIIEPDSTMFIQVKKYIGSDLTTFVNDQELVEPNLIMCALR